MYFELFSTTVTLARSFNVTPFEIMAQDCDEVIMLINHFIQKAEHDDAPAQQNVAAHGSRKQFVQVTDKTATGGWW